jgi:hypothetical protein
VTGAVRENACADLPRSVRMWDCAKEKRLREAVKIFTGLGASAAALITRQKTRQLGIRSMDAPTRDVAASHAARLGLVGTAER